jgi:hypothetical protein
MSRVIAFYFIVLATYFALKTIFSGVALIEAYHVSQFFIAANFLGIVVELARKTGFWGPSGSRLTVCRSVIWLDMVLLLIIEILVASSALDLRAPLIVSQVLVLATLGLCVALIPDEKGDLEKNKASDYNQHGGMR